MARFSNDIQEHEVRAYEKFCIEHGILIDDSAASIENANLVRDYFTKTWNEVITEETLEKALPQLRPHLKFKSTPRLEYEKVASENTHAAQQLVTWLDTQGKSGQLANTGDDAYKNLTELLLELRGYEVTSANIKVAIDRIQAPRGRFVSREGRRPLHYVQAPRRTEVVSRAAKEDDGTPFVTSGLTLQKDGSLGKSPADYAREARERSELEAAKSGAAASAAASAAAVREAQRQALQLRGNTHSEDAQLQAIFVTTPGTSEIDWQATLQSRLVLQRSLNKHREVARFIR